MLKIAFDKIKKSCSDNRAVTRNKNVLPLFLKPPAIISLSILFAFSYPAVLFAVGSNDAEDDKCSLEKWSKLESEYLDALRASDIGRLQGLKSKRAALLQECGRSGQTGAGGSTTSPGGSGPTATGPGTAPTTPGGGGSTTGPGGSGPTATGPGTAPITPGGGSTTGPGGSGPTATGPGTPPTTPGGGGSTSGPGGSGPTATGPGATPVTPGDDKPAGSTAGLSAAEQARKDEWDKRQDLTESMVRDQAMFEEANTGAVTTVWNDFWGSVGESFGVTDPPEPLKPPSFDELLANGDPLATRLQQIRDQVGEGVPTQQQLDEIRDLSREAQQGQNAAGVALVETNTTAADLATAGEVISKVGVEAGKAAAVYIMVTTYGMDPKSADAAASAVYDGLQHYDKGVTSVLGHAAVSAGSSYLGNVAGGKLGDHLGDAANTTGGLIKQGALSGGSSAAASSIGNTVVEGKDLNAGDVITDTVIGTLVGAGTKAGGAGLSDKYPDAGLSGDDFSTVIGIPVKPAAGEVATIIKDGIKADPESPAVSPAPVKLPDTLTETKTK